ncbi:hypothetical protein MMC07_009197 [Pseudocyphellaria aurata]|nr:hypothetical protein [Pseudocyphellaria aurata]
MSSSLHRRCWKRVGVAIPGWANYARGFRNRRREADFAIFATESVDIGKVTDFAFMLAEPSTQIPTRLFQSATKVTLVGQINFHLAKTILNSVNPEVLTYLHLKMIVDRKIREFTPGQEVEDERRAMIGLLPILSGRCTALRILTLR